MKPDKLYLKPVGGLCNRMRAVDTAVALAAQLDKQLVVFWGRDNYLNCKFSDLFEASEYFQVIEEKQYLGRKALFPYLPGTKPTSSFRKALYGLTQAMLNIKAEIWFEDLEEAVSPLTSNINPERISSMKEFDEKSLSYIKPLLEPLHHKSSSFICTAWKLTPGQNYTKHFAPIDALSEVVNKISVHFSHTIGVHIRRTDHASAIAHSNLEKFVNAMKQELKQNGATTFYLATDCKDTEQELVKLFPEKIFIYPKSSYSRNSTHGIQEALVDLYALSKTSKVLGSYYSSFSQVATEISGIEEVTIY